MVGKLDPDDPDLVVFNPNLNDVTMTEVPGSGLGCALDMFREKDEVMEILNSLPTIYHDNSLIEISYQRYTTILNLYQEQPHLLDRHLDQMIETCLNLTRSSSSEELAPLKHLSLKYLRLVFKVRGPKEVVRRMPHEISDLVPVLTFLENENLDNPDTWESGYVLTMWLSILVINPFSLKLFDGVKDDSTGQRPLIAERILNVCMKLITLNNAIGNAAPTLIAKFLTRPDMLDLYMERFIDFACNNLGEKVPFGQRGGSFSALNAIFKQGKRQEILKYSKQVLQSVLSSNYEKADTIIRKHGNKLIQRIGMTFLRTKLAPWRYTRGSRSLLSNLRPEQMLQKNNEMNLDTLKKNESGDYEELTQFSNEIESILDRLFEGIKDKDTVVRWSAAKGIGRVTNRLPKEYAEEVMETLLGMFTEREANMAWHGACLALAELARRGLLLPERLSFVLPVIKRALIYDEIQGNFSIGSHVRDAGCYVCWAFARAFDPKVIEPFVHELATSLIITMVFDREINVRRAAAAAFQENVGRQGNFPHGIDIITIADYFSIGNRNNAYTNISVEIAKYPEYTRSLIDHLITLKFNHFDVSVRELTAEALSNLTHLDPAYMQFVMVNNFLPKCADTDIRTCHGAIICLSSVLLKLTELNKLDLSSSDSRDIRNIIPNICQRQFRGNNLGSEMTRMAMVNHIKCCSKARLPFHNDQDLMDIWHNVLTDCLSFQESTVRSHAAETVPLYLQEYYLPKNKTRMSEYLRGFCSQIQSPVLITRQGYCQSIGQFPLNILNEDLPLIIDSVIASCKITEKTETWAEARKDAINALSNICLFPLITSTSTSSSSTTETGILISKLTIKKIYDTLLTCIEDYTTDKRGDIGSLVREAAMTALKVFTVSLHKCDLDGKLGLLDQEVLAKVIGHICKQCIEKIDRVRVLAGSTFASLIHNTPPITQIPQLEELKNEFPPEFCQTVNWRSPTLVFPKFASLLALDEYRYYLLSGFIISGGSSMDNLMQESFQGISDYIISVDSPDLEIFGQVLIKIFKENMGCDRVTIPLMKFVTQYLQSGLLSSLLIEGQDEFGKSFIDLVKVTMKTTRIDKLFACIEVLCEMIDGDTKIAKLSLSKIAISMNHIYPRVRVVTAQKLYEVLLTNGENLNLPEGQLEEAVRLLSETNWEAEIDITKPIRNRICELMNIPVPTMKNKRNP